MKLTGNRYNQLPINTPFYYGWMIVFISALGVFFSGPGQTYSVSVFIDSYIAEFGWSRSFVSTLYSSGTLLAGLLLPVIGKLVDRLGSRFMVAAVAATFGLVCLAMSLVFSPVMLFAGFFLVRLLGQGSMTLTSSTLVPQWFVSRRGKALSLMALGGTLSSALLPPLNTWLILSFGWRFGWQVWAVLLWAIMVPAALFLIRNRPEDVGLAPDNARAAKLASGPEQQYDQHSWTVKEAMATRAFWLLLFCATIPAAINTGVTFHLASIMQDTGFAASAAPAIAAAVLSTLAIVQLPFNFVAGALADKFRVHLLMMLAFAGQLLSLLLLLNIRSLPMAIVYGVLWGMLSGFYAINNGVIWPNYFGRRYLGSIRGIAMTAMVIGSAFGPLPFGFAFDYFGGYREIILLSMIMPALGMLAAFLSPPPPRSSEQLAAVRTRTGI